VSADEQNLIWFVSALDLENYIAGVPVGSGLILEDQLEVNLLASVLHSLQHLRIFDGDCGDGDGLAVLSASVG
jgi:hypothetical protein